MKLKKGDYGFLKKNKITKLLICFGLMLVIFLIFYTGFLKFHTTKNIFTVMAVVMVIPFARFMVTYIVIMPYSGLTRDEYEELNSEVSIDGIYDLIISSTEKVYNIKAAFVRDNAVVMYSDNKKINKSEVEKYVKSFLEKECKITGVKMLDSFEAFVKYAKNFQNNTEGRYDKRISELLKVFSM